MKKLLKRFPSAHSIIQVFAVVAFMVYAWSIGWFLWSLPSWLKFMTTGEILSGFSYVLGFSLIESLAFLIFLLGWCFILPATILRDEFIARGTVVAISIIGSVMIYLRYFISAIRLDNHFYLFLLTLLLSIIVIAFVSTAFPRLHQFINWLSDSFIIFLYILVPLSLFSILVVVIRNVI